MPDPFETAVAKSDLKRDKTMDNVVRKALKRRKRRKPRRKYSKLAALATTIPPNVLSNSQYGAAAWGGIPPVRTTSNDGWEDTKDTSKVTHTKYAALEKQSALPLALLASPGVRKLLGKGIGAVRSGIGHILPFLSPGAGALRAVGKRGGPAMSPIGSLINWAYPGSSTQRAQHQQAAPQMLNHQPSPGPGAPAPTAGLAPQGGGGGFGGIFSSLFGGGRAGKRDAGIPDLAALARQAGTPDGPMAPKQSSDKESKMTDADRWPGIYKQSGTLQDLGIHPRWLGRGARVGASSLLPLVGAGIGGVGGGLLGLARPEEDEETGEKQRLLTALKYALMGAGAGGLAGAGGGAAYGALRANNLANKLPEIVRRGVQNVEGF